MTSNTNHSDARFWSVGGSLTWSFEGVASLQQVPLSQPLKSKQHFYRVPTANNSHFTRYHSTKFFTRRHVTFTFESLGASERRSCLLLAGAQQGMRIGMRLGKPSKRWFPLFLGIPFQLVHSIFHSLARVPLFHYEKIDSNPDLVDFPQSATIFGFKSISWGI